MSERRTERITAMRLNPHDFIYNNIHRATEDFNFVAGTVEYLQFVPENLCYESQLILLRRLGCWYLTPLDVEKEGKAMGRK